MYSSLNVLFIVASENDVIPVLQEFHKSGLHPVWDQVSTADSLHTLLPHQSWQVIIADYDLPELGALAALSIVHKSQLDIPFIVISGVAGERLAVKMLKAGAHEYLMKEDLALLPAIVEREMQMVSLLSKRNQEIIALKTAEATYRTIYNNASEGIYQSSPEGCYLMANPSLARIYGYASSNSLITELNDIKHQLYVNPQQREEFEQILIQQGYISGFEAEVYRRDGTTLWISENGRLVRDEQGYPIYYEGFVTDISDRKKAKREREWFINLSRNLLCLFSLEGDFTEVDPAWEKALGYDSNDKQAQQQLQHLNQALEVQVKEQTKALSITQSAVDFAADCIFLARADASFHYVNNTACDKLGYSKKELASMKVWDINPAISPKNWLDAWQVLKQQKTFTTESQHRTKDGTIYPIEINTKYLIFDGEEYCFSFASDISARKRLEAERQLAVAILKIENTFRQQILENMAEGLCVCHPIPEPPFIHHTVWNQRMQVITGYSLKEINCLGMIPGLATDAAESRSYITRYVEQLQTEGCFVDREAEIQRKDGQQRTVEISTSVLSGSEGQLTILSLIQDITERKQRQESARLLAAVVESTDNAIITKKLDGTITSWNSAAVNLFGYTEAEAIGQPIAILFPRDRLDIESQIIARLKNGERIKNLETVNLHKDGFPIQVSATISPLKDETGQVVGASKIIHDITQQKQVEMQLRFTNEELMRATRLKDEFLANMSHELRTPLNAILGMAESLQEQVFGQLYEQQVKPLEMIRRSGNHLLELINDILDLAKIESGQVELALKPTTIVPLCQSSLDFIQQQANQKHIQVKAQFPSCALNVSIDERRIRQVLINLLSNAVKFTPEGGHVTLTVNLLRQSPEMNHSLHIAISDTGIGIEPKHISKLFEPFIQLDGALNRKYSGTGLGLALVKRIVELHGGDVGVTSQIGKGSCFTVVLPGITVPVFPPAESPDSLSSSQFHQTSPARISLILLADNKEANIITTMSYLRAKGHRIRIAPDTQAVAALSQAEHPDVILVDSQLSGDTQLSGDSQLSGIHTLDAIRQIRLTPALANLPMIALMAPAIDYEQTQYHAAGVHHILRKPFKLKQLLDTIQKLHSSS
ncbi:MAG: PAS domain S-box protein [Leptolyngbyaceae cyanobacterium]